MALAMSACADDSNETAGDAAAAAGSTVPEASVDPAPTPAPTPSVPDAFTPVIAATVGDETAPVLGSDGQWHVVYELLLTNANAVPATIDRIDVLELDGRVSTATTVDVLTDEDFAVPTTADLGLGATYAVNARFGQNGPAGTPVASEIVRVG